VLDLIEPVAWTVRKIEAINPYCDFWWIDDDPTECDRDWLRFHCREDRFIQVSVDHNPGALAVARAILDRATSSLFL
jgi:hypothetical protein